MATSADAILPAELRERLKRSGYLRNLEQSYYRDVHGTEESSAEVEASFTRRSN